MALCALALAALAHVGAGGHLTISPLLLTHAVLTTTGAVWLSRRQWTFGRLMVVLSATQLLFHLAAGPNMNMHAHDGSGGMITADTMALAHLCAALVMSAVLARVDTIVLRAISTVIVALVTTMRARPVWSAQPHFIAPINGVLVRRSVHCAYLVPLRGPPSFPL